MHDPVAVEFLKEFRDKGVVGNITFNKRQAWVLVGSCQIGATAGVSESIQNDEVLEIGPGQKSAGQCRTDEASTAG